MEWEGDGVRDIGDGKDLTVFKELWRERERLGICLETSRAKLDGKTEAEQRED